MCSSEVQKLPERSAPVYLTQTPARTAEKLCENEFVAALDVIYENVDDDLHRRTENTIVCT
jgi:hypothetical protein